MGKKKTKSEFVELARNVYGNKYSYDKFDYIDYHTKSVVTCSIHGDFYVSPANHLKGRGCRKCGCAKLAEERKKTTEEFIKEAKGVHGNTYDYSKVNYINSKTKVCIICHEHGEFWQLPNKHTKQKRGCPKCNGGVLSNVDEFIKKAKNIHGDSYIYTDVIYKNAITPVSIICKKHGVFLCTPHSHLQGQGCPRCNDSVLERTTSLFLSKNYIKHEQNKHFIWLGKQHLDFYLPEYNIAIECQGAQHYFPTGFGGISKEEAEERLKYRIELDKRKAKLCEENNLPLEYIDYNENVEERINEILTKYNSII